jgi:uncharacterized alkaline shock family protein YloU
MGNDQKNADNLPTLNKKELENAETVYIRDIENRVFQVIVLQCLSGIKDISLLDGSIIDHLLERGGIERARGISVEQESKNQTVSVRVEVNIRYGVPIPQKAEEIQTKISEEITRLTALHVSSVHVIFKSVLLKDPSEYQEESNKAKEKAPFVVDESFEEEFAGEFS